MHKGNLDLLIDELGDFIENWYMAPTTVMECLEQAHHNACLNRWKNGKIPNHVIDYRLKVPDEDVSEGIFSQMKKRQDRIEENST